MSGLRLRGYQQDWINGVNAAMAAGINRPAVVAATGLGKAVALAQLTKDRAASHPRERIVIWVHRDELATQARDKVHQLAPHLRPGIVKADQRDHDRQVIVASMQTAYRPKRRDQIRNVGYQIVDECHHSAADTWRETLEYFGAFDGVPTVGFTATMSREDRRGLGEIWQHIVPRPDDPSKVWDTEWGIRNRYLCDVRGIRVQVPQLDLSSVHVRAGDLQQEETAAAMLDANTGEAIVKAIQTILEPEYGKRRGVVFAPNVATALDFAEAMNAAGIVTETILGSTPPDERRRIFARFRTGETAWLTNAMVLTEGWDAPWCDALVIARPTKSAGLYQQMIGRGLRLFAGKQECVVLDVCGATDVHGLASLTDLSLDGNVTPKDGQSLLEALDEFDFNDPELTGPTWEPVPPPIHKVVGTEIDMFGNSHSVWLQTKAGTWFVPAADRLYFLWPRDDGKFTLGTTPKVRPEPAVALQDDLDLEIGMALAERHALDYAPEHAGKDAPWRLKGPATRGQRRDCEQWGVPVRRTMSSAQAYDAINVAMATVRLDR